jgi:hypothetical protein
MQQIAALKRCLPMHQDPYCHLQIADGDVQSYYCGYL